MVYTYLGAHDQAANVFAQAVASAPRHAGHHYNLTTALVATGDLEGAQQQIRACLELDPHYWRAYHTRSQLRRYSATDNHVEVMQGLLGQIDAQQHPGQQKAKVCLHMALAKELEDLGRYPTALAHLAEGKAIAGGTRSYASPLRDQALFDALRERFKTAPTDAPEGYGTDEPIFVVGMPRTGTTLVERILSSHPDVQSAGELLNFPMALKALSDVSGAALLEASTVAASTRISMQALGRAHLESTRPLTGASRHFVDKLPHNFLYVGYIAQALPRARIICLRRHPMDTCLSNFRQFFAPQSTFFDYSFDLLDTGRYFIMFTRLMEHWKRVLPGRVLEVDYESLVRAQETQSRRIIGFFGPPWSNDCLHFENNASPVATASAVQVRTPIPPQGGEGMARPSIH